MLCIIYFIVMFTRIIKHSEKPAKNVYPYHGAAARGGFPFKRIILFSPQTKNSQNPAALIVRRRSSPVPLYYTCTPYTRVLDIRIRPAYKCTETMPRVATML